MMDPGRDARISLEDYGLSDALADAFDSGGESLEPGRIVFASGTLYRAVTRDGEKDVGVAGKLRYEAASATELPAVGDWVGLRNDRIERLVPRTTCLSRRAAGRRTVEQVVAANVDTVVVVMGLDADFSARRLERYLTTIWESGAAPVVLLNKTDLAVDLAAKRETIDSVALGAPVVSASCLHGTGLEPLEARLRARETAVLVGSSGAGKSTLINRLLGAERQRTKDVRATDETGRHTTTHRELFRLPCGALLIDNPGIRELQLWADEASLDQSFEDVVGWAEGCRYRDCRHGNEPGCAVTAAVDAGTLAPERLQSYRGLQKELEYLRIKQDESAQRAQKQKWRAIHKEMRRSGRHRRT